MGSSHFRYAVASMPIGGQFQTGGCFRLSSIGRRYPGFAPYRFREFRTATSCDFGPSGPHRLPTNHPPPYQPAPSQPGPPSGPPGTSAIISAHPECNAFTPLRSLKRCSEKRGRRRMPRESPHTPTPIQYRRNTPRNSRNLRTSEALAAPRFPHNPSSLSSARSSFLADLSFPKSGALTSALRRIAPSLYYLRKGDPISSAAGLGGDGGRGPASLLHGGAVSWRL